MFTVILMGLAGLLAGGAIAFKRQQAPKLLIISFWVTAVLAVIAGWLLTF